MKRIFTLSNKLSWCFCLMLMCLSFSAVQAQDPCLETVCGVDDPINDLVWLSDIVNAPFGNICSVTSYITPDETYILVTYKQNPLIADLPFGTIYNCAGDGICSLGGFTTIEAQCSFQGIDLNVIGGGQVLYSNGCDAPGAIPGLADPCQAPCTFNPSGICATDYTPVCGCDGVTYSNACNAQTAGIITWTAGECGTFCNEEVCGVTDPVNNLPWLNAFANQSYVCTITQYEQAFGYPYFLVSEYQNPMIPDIPLGVLYDCGGNWICTLGGFTLPEFQCSFQGIDLELIGGKVIYTNGCTDPGDIPGLADDCYSECLFEPNVFCPTVYEPVCGCDGQTYSNACFAEIEGLISWTEGECSGVILLENLVISPKVFLQGALMNTTDGMMKDALRQSDLLPELEPYSNLDNFGHVGAGGGEVTTASVLANSGPDAIVDWVYLELRSESDPAQVLTTCAALLQRDGDVVSEDGISPVMIQGQSAGNYYVAIKHRNHLGAMTAQPISLNNSSTTIDFSTIQTWGDNAQVDMGGYNALWGGNVNSDGSILFQGANNELNDSFFEIIGAPSNTSNIANYIFIDYNQSDVDLNAESIYQGAGNDIDLIFFNIISHPESSASSNFIVAEQIP